MPRARLDRLDAASKARLFDVAMRHFGEHGFERASLNRILAEAGLGKSSYYYYFDDKRDLLRETLRVAVEDLYRAAPHPAPPRSRERFWGELEAHMQRLVRALESRPHVIGLFASLQRSHVVDPFFDPLRAEMRELYFPILRAGQKLGCVRDDLPLPVLANVWEAADAALDLTLLADGGKMTPARIEAHAALAFDVFRRLLETSRGDTKTGKTRQTKPTKTKKPPGAARVPRVRA